MRQRPSTHELVCLQAGLRRRSTKHQRAGHQLRMRSCRPSRPGRNLRGPGRVLRMFDGACVLSTATDAALGREGLNAAPRSRAPSQIVGIHRAHRTCALVVRGEKRPYCCKTGGRPRACLFFGQSCHGSTVVGDEWRMWAKISSCCFFLKSEQFNAGDLDLRRKPAGRPPFPESRLKTLSISKSRGVLKRKPGQKDRAHLDLLRAEYISENLQTQIGLLRDSQHGQRAILGGTP